jgi:hypothetical protein
MKANNWIISHNSLGISKTPEQIPPSLTQNFQQNIRDIISANLQEEQEETEANTEAKAGHEEVNQPYEETPADGTKRQICMKKTKSTANNRIKVKSDATAMHLELQISSSSSSSHSLSPLAVANPDIHCKYD